MNKKNSKIRGHPYLNWGPLDLQSNAQLYPTAYQNYKYKKQPKEKVRGHPDFNWGPLDLQANALPLSYTPRPKATVYSKDIN